MPRIAPGHGLGELLGRATADPVEDVQTCTTRGRAWLDRGGAPLLLAARRLERNRDQRVDRSLEDRVRVGLGGDRLGLAGVVETRAQIVEVPDDAGTGRLDGPDLLVGAGAGPVVVLRRQQHLGLLPLAGGEDVLGDVVLEDPVVDRDGETLLLQPLVDPAHQLGRLQAERGVGAEVGEVVALRVDVDDLSHPPPQLGRVGAALRQRDDVQPLGGDARAPALEEHLHVLLAPERLARRGPHRVLAGHLLEELRPAPRGAVLAELLPRGGDGAGDVADGEDDVHLGGCEVGRDALDLRRGGHAQPLHRHQGVLGPGLHLGDEPVPGTRDDRLLRRRGLHPAHVLDRLHLTAPRVAGVEQPRALLQGGLVLAEHCLEVGRPALGQADVQEDSLGHAVTISEGLSPQTTFPCP